MSEEEPAQFRWHVKCHTSLWILRPNLLASPKFRVSYEICHIYSDEVLLLNAVQLDLLT